MRVTVHADKELANEIRAQIRVIGGYCPCVLPSQRNEDTRCMCKAFRESPAGTVCHCGLYKKIED